MREDTLFILEREFMFVIAGQLFAQAPNRQPRDAEIIMQKVRDKFRSDPRCYNYNESYSIRLPKCDFLKFTRSLLFDIPEFQNLNLSQIEYENNIDVNDPSRNQFKLTSVHDKYDADSWKHDFIDLDAFIQNVVYRFNLISEIDCDCFGCIYQDDADMFSAGNSNKCSNCTVNPTYKNNFTGSRLPKGKYTFACKYDCYKSRYICCEECDDNKNCKYKCESSSDSCKLALYK